MAELSEKTFFAFDTVNTVGILGGDEQVLDDVEELCRRYEMLFSHTLTASGLSRINGADGKRVEVDPELAECIAASLRYCAAVQGLFDITMGPVVRLWDFKQGAMPAETAIEQALSHVDYRKVHVEGCSVQLEDPEASIVLGGIAKGFIADRIRDLLASRGVCRAVVNLGGNVAVMGGKPDGSAWRIGIRSPRPAIDGQPARAIAAVELEAGSVVTSGIYDRSFRTDGTLYHHILDPQTGFPAQTNLAAASVVSERSIDGDGFSTALIIMGSRRALEFIEAREGIEAVLVTDDGRIETTSGIGTRIPFAKAAGPCSL